MARPASDLAEVRAVAASTDELEELQEAVGEVVEPLDAFADAERTWRRTWSCPGTVDGAADAPHACGVIQEVRTCRLR